MTKVTRSSLGFDVPVGFYADVPEFDKAAGKDGACLNEANLNLFYRSGAAQEARELISATIAKVTGVARKTEPVVDAEKKPVLKDGQPVTKFAESEEKHVERALAQVNKTVKDYQADITSAINASNDGKGLAVDAQVTERKSGGAKKILQASMKANAELILKDPKKLAAFRKKVKTVLNKDVPIDADSVSAGWLLQEVVEAGVQAEKEALKAARAKALDGLV